MAQRQELLAIFPVNGMGVDGKCKTTIQNGKGGELFINEMFLGLSVRYHSYLCLQMRQL